MRQFYIRAACIRTSEDTEGRKMEGKKILARFFCPDFSAVPILAVLKVQLRRPVEILGLIRKFRGIFTLPARLGVTPDFKAAKDDGTKVWNTNRH